MARRIERAPEKAPTTTLSTRMTPAELAELDRAVSLERERTGYNVTRTAVLALGVAREVRRILDANNE